MAARRFGESNVGWHLWPDERFWRVNGTKDQINPMPLELLSLKADCRFHVRRDKDRPGSAATTKPSR